MRLTQYNHICWNFFGEISITRESTSIVSIIYDYVCDDISYHVHHEFDHSLVYVVIWHCLISLYEFVYFELTDSHAVILDTVEKQISKI